jgi:hypothetical protein
MHNKLTRFVEGLVLATLTLLNLCAISWAGPPLPPFTTPATPVGGTEVIIATSAAIAAYGIWKSRK